MKFKSGDLVRYKPGNGTYGYEDVLDADGRVDCTVVGFTTTRVRVRVDHPGRMQGSVRVVDAASLATRV